MDSDNRNIHQLLHRLALKQTITNLQYYLGSILQAAFVPVDLSSSPLKSIEFVAQKFGATYELVVLSANFLGETKAFEANSLCWPIFALCQ